MFCTFSPNLVSLAWTGVEFLCGQTWWRTDGRTQATTIPGGQNWPRVKMVSKMLGNILDVHSEVFWPSSVEFEHINAHQINTSKSRDLIAAAHLSNPRPTVDTTKTWNNPCDLNLWPFDLEMVHNLMDRICAKYEANPSNRHGIRAKKWTQQKLKTTHVTLTFELLRF